MMPMKLLHDAILMVLSAARRLIYDFCFYVRGRLVMAAPNFYFKSITPLSPIIYSVTAASHFPHKIFLSYSRF